MKQTILVTGASSGIGLLIANRLHNSGHRVIGTSRNPDKHESDVPFKLLPLDIADETSIQSFREALFNQIDRLDVLINNAGYLVTGLAEETSVAMGKQQFETNFWGTVRLTTELLPNFRAQKQGRIITIGSMLGLMGLPNVAYYSASKHALEGYFKALRFELNQFNIKVCMIEPMGFKTSIGENAARATGEIDEYNSYRQKILAFTKREFDKAPGPEPVVEKVMKILAERVPRFSYPVGTGASFFLGLQRYAYNAFEGAILKRINQERT